MTRLIDADELNEYIGREALDTREKIFALVDRMPTVERPHGEWTKLTIYKSTCSCCKNVIDRQMFVELPNFCPNCGSDNRPRENTSSSMIINGKYSENVEYGTRIEIGERKGGE